MEINTFLRPARVIQILHTMGISTIITVAVFLTGFASISYQMIIERLIKLVVGGTAASSFIVTFTTLVGMGIGGAVAVLPIAKKILPYRSIMLISAVYTLISAVATLPWLQSISRFVIVQHIGSQTSLVLLHAGAIAVTLPAAILFGAIIPRIMHYADRGFSRSPGFLYGSFTIGSVAGIYALIRIFLPLMDTDSIFLVIAGIFVCIFGIFLWADTKLQPAILKEIHVKSIRLPKKYMVALCISSAASIVLELSVFRAIAVTWGSASPYAYPFALLTYLTAYAAGSYVLAPLYKRMLPTIGLAPLFLLLPVAFAITLYTPKTIPDQGLISLFFIGGFEHSAIIAFLSGAMFPLIISLSAPSDWEHESGVLSFVSSIGSFLGGLLLAYVGIPLLGTRASILLLFVIYLSAVLLLLSHGKNRVKYAVYSAVLIMILANIPGYIWNQWIQKSASPFSQRVEGIGGIAVIDWEDSLHSAGPVTINGTTASHIPYLYSHSILAAISSGAPSREHVLILGLGGGGIVRDILALANVKTVDVVEWSNELIALIRKPEASTLLSHPLEDPRVTVFPTDAHTFASTALALKKTYSLMIDNLTVIGWSGSTSVRSIEYFRSMMPLLTDDGVYIIMLHHNYQRQYDAAIAGLSRVCPFLSSYDTTFVICSKQEIAWDTEYMDRILSQYSEIPALQNALRAQDKWLYQKYTRVQKNNFAAIEPIHDMTPYFEYEEFSVLRKQ